MKIILIYVAAALAEIAGCFSFWAWIRLGKSFLWLIPGMCSLAVFGWLLALVPSDCAGEPTLLMVVSISLLRLCGNGVLRGFGQIDGI